MNKAEFRKYVYEKKCEGMSDSQIARSLSMSLAHFKAMLSMAERVVDVQIEKQYAAEPAEKVEVPEPPKEEKPVSGFEETEPVKPRPKRKKKSEIVEEIEAQE